MIKKNSSLEVRQGPKELKIYHQGDRPSSGALAMVPLRDGRESGAYATAAYIQLSPLMHQLLCDLNDHMHAFSHHDKACSVESTGECTCGLDNLLVRTVNVIHALERTDESYALGI